LSKFGVLLGVSGGIAAYKAVDLASRLTQAGATVRVVMTANATRLVGPKSFEAVTGEPVAQSLWNDKSKSSIGHIDLADWADIVVVAPATANIIAKAAQGICDDMLSTTLCASWQKLKVLAPAMNERMWTNPATKRNIERLDEMGYELVGPTRGILACGSEGTGRMAEPEDIVARVKEVLARGGK